MTDEFSSLEEVRASIDRLDGELVRILAERAQCVAAAARFKTSEAAVRAPDRLASMLAARGLGRRRGVTRRAATRAEERATPP